MEGNRRSARRHHGCMSSDTDTERNKQSTRPRRNESRSSSRTNDSGSKGAARSIDEGCAYSTRSKDTKSKASTNVGSKPTSSSSSSSKMDDSHSRLNNTVLYSQSNSNRRTCAHTTPCDCAEIDENKFYFVIPSDCTRDTLSKSMVAAHADCASRDFNITWIEDRELKDFKFTRGSMFVMDKFEGRGFTFLETKLAANQDFMIIGPQVLNYMFHRDVAEYIKCTGVPIFSLAMMNVVVSSTGVRDIKKQEIAHLINTMGGRYDAKYTLQVTHMVASSVLTQKTIFAKRKKLPVMTPEWVETVWEKSQTELVHATDPQFATFEVPIFYNLVFSFSQLSTQQKLRLQQSIEGNGGTYSPDLIRKSTNILILVRGEGEKFRHAKSWDILCLRPDWIKDSCEAGYAVFTDTYVVNSADHPLSSTMIGDEVKYPKNVNLTSCTIMTSSNTNMSQAVNASHVSSSTCSESMVVRAGNLPEFTEDEAVAEVPIVELDDDDAEAQVTKVPALLTSEGQNHHSKSSGKTSGSSRDHEPTSINDLGLDDADNEIEGNGHLTPEPLESVFCRRKFLLQLDNDQPAYERTLDMIEAVGGIVVTKDEPFDFIITPPVITEEEISRDHQYYTEHWLVDCDEVNSTQIEPAFYHYPVIGCPEVIGLFNDIVIAVSTYTFAERTYVAALASYMGAVVQEVFAKKAKGSILATTHLVSNTIDNQKGEAAIRWKLPVITCEWILKCYSKKRLLDTAPFSPALGDEENETDSQTMIDIPAIKRPTLNEGPPPMEVTNEKPNTSRRTNEKERKSSASSGAVEIPNNSRTSTNSVGTPVNPRVLALGGGRPSGNKLSLGLDSPLSQETHGKGQGQVESPPYRYIFPTMAEMLAEAEEAEEMTLAVLRARYPPLPSPDTPKLHAEWLEHLRVTWLQPKNLEKSGDLNSSRDEVREDGAKLVENTDIENDGERRRTMSRNSSSMALHGGNSNPTKRARRTPQYEGKNTWE